MIYNVCIWNSITTRMKMDPELFVTPFYILVIWFACIFEETKTITLYV